MCFLSAVVFPWLLCSALLLVFGVGPAWPALSLHRSPPALPAPLVSPLVPSGPVSALLVPPSGYLVVFTMARLSCFACCVVTVWHLSSLLFMATKASALCGAPPSTPCCMCCFGAPPSCTEVFTLWVIQIPPQDAARAACAPLLGPCCFLPPVPAAFPGALSPFPAGLRLLPSPSSFFVRWLPLPVSLPLCFLVCCLVPLCFGLLLWLLVLFLSGFCLVWSSLFFVCLLVVWWAVLAASLLR